MQFALFSRHLTGIQDTLIGWTISSTIIKDQAVIQASGTDIHPILQMTENVTDCVHCMALEKRQTDLPLAD